MLLIPTQRKFIFILPSTATSYAKIHFKNGFSKNLNFFSLIPILFKKYLLVDFLFLAIKKLWQPSRYHDIILVKSNIYFDRNIIL